MQRVYDITSVRMYTVATEFCGDKVLLPLHAWERGYPDVTHSNVS